MDREKGWAVSTEQVAVRIGSVEIQGLEERPWHRPTLEHWRSSTE